MLAMWKMFSMMVIIQEFMLHSSLHLALLLPSLPSSAAVERSASHNACWTCTHSACWSLSCYRFCSQSLSLSIMMTFNKQPSEVGIGSGQEDKSLQLINRPSIKFNEQSNVAVITTQLTMARFHLHLAAQQTLHNATLSTHIKVDADLRSVI